MTTKIVFNVLSTGDLVAVNNYRITRNDLLKEADDVVGAEVVI